MLKKLIAALLAVLMVPAVAVAQPAEEPALSAKCQAVAAERAYRQAQGRVDVIAERWRDEDGNTRTHTREERRAWRTALAALEVPNEDGRTLREEFHHWLGEWAEETGWRIVSDRRLKDARSDCR